jgi:hypothetical protein
MRSGGVIALLRNSGGEFMPGYNLHNFSRTALVTARLISLNRTRRGAYNDVNVVNSSGGLVMLQLS